MDLFFNKKNTRGKNSSNQRGATIIIVALMLIVFLGFAALAIDIGYVMAARNEAQNVADAAALAGARELGDQLMNNEPVNESDIITAAKETALKNQIAGENYILQDNEIEIGFWNGEELEPDPDKDNTTGVKVTIRSQSVGTFFARILKIDAFSVGADATAALTAKIKVDPGVIEVPFGVSDSNFTGGLFEGDIEVDENSGWHVFEEYPANTNQFNDVLEGLIDGTYQTPGMTIGASDLTYYNGVAANNFVHSDDKKPDMLELYKANEEDGKWTTIAPIFEGINPSGELEIVGFAEVTITNVYGANEGSYIEAHVEKISDDFRGEGGLIGTVSPYPGLVE